MLITRYQKIVRYDNKLWKDKVINSELKRKEGSCPLTPEETAILLSSLGLDHTVQIYIAAGEIYGGQRRMANLEAAFPNLVSWMKLKQSLTTAFPNLVSWM